MYIGRHSVKYSASGCLALSLPESFPTPSPIAHNVSNDITPSPVRHGISIANMAPNISEEEIDDLIYFARAGEKDDLVESLTSLSTRENVSTAEILVAAKDEAKSTCLHMAAGNGHAGTKIKTRASSRWRDLVARSSV